MNTENIQSIGELIEPSPIEFGFGAPGWYLLLALLLMVIICIALWQFYKYRKNKYRRLAIVEIEEVYNSKNSIYEVLTEMISILKRVALTAYNRDGLASINGKEFVSFLNSKTKEKIFTDQYVEVFTKQLYQGKNIKISTKELNGFFKESINWINKHNV